jgi:hypothetical protein
MANKRIYISCPIAVDKKVLVDFSKLVDAINGLTSCYWERGSIYDQNMFDTSDAYLFILPYNRFKADNSDLPIGLRRELLSAYKTGKKIFIGYITKSGEYTVYSAKTNGSDIEGIPGTTHEISSLVEKEFSDYFDYEQYLNPEKIKRNTNYSFDERALLMLQ